MPTPRTTIVTLACVVTATLVTMSACTSTPNADADPATIPAHAHDDDAPNEGFSVVASVDDVMTAKLAHAHAIMEGVAIGDDRQIESNAMDMKRLSDEAGFRVHTTPAYGILSDQFGMVALDLASAARRGDENMIIEQYSQLVRSCVRCHTYMRSEGLFRDQAGEMSWVGEWSSRLVGVATELPKQPS